MHKEEVMVYFNLAAVKGTATLTLQQIQQEIPYVLYKFPETQSILTNPAHLIYKPQGISYWISLDAK